MPVSLKTNVDSVREKMSKELQVIDRLPLITKNEALKDYLKAIVKERVRAEFRGLLYECFESWLGSKRAKEIREERKEIKRQQKVREEMAEWKRKFDAEREAESHNPTINTKEASQILGISPTMLCRLIKKKKIKPVNNDRTFGYFFKQNEITAIRDLMPGLVRTRKRRKNEIKEGGDDLHDKSC
jgi:hypothetical protein